MARFLLKFIKISAISYVLFLAILYLFQEKLIFLPQKIDQNFSYKFSSNFSEIWLENGDIKLNALHFKSENPKGIVVFMHGNYGNLSQWGDLADGFLKMGYDFLIYDYRGYGKSGGKITSESELYSDARVVLGYALQSFSKDEIVVVGYSIGSGIAAKISSENELELLLVAPYESLEILAKEMVKIAPKFLIKYKIKTYEFLQSKRSKTLIIHDKNDEIIPILHSLKLAKFIQNGKFYELNAGHNDILRNGEFYEIFRENF